MTDKVPKPAELIHLATQIGSRVKLDRVVLGEAQITRGTAKPTSEEIELRAKYGFDVSHRYEKEERKLQAVVDYLAAGLFVDKGKEVELFKIKSSFFVDYTVQGEDVLTQSTVDAFSKINGVYNTWPYWREWVQNITVRLGFPALTLPLITGERIEQAFAGQASVKSASRSSAPRALSRRIKQQKRGKTK